ncbi:hypothetical protein D9615_006126 [Tricholomella constricta]|uniref:Uncharacterized protein n=1 Tax=Tricholomella constricta TaxID=117010 RepID=A0A8H5HB90_9AGAR|nr:hypothetical protein D9615_006126 [Tricholomella constricta]
MAENNRPAAKVDLAKAARKQRTDKGTRTPMSSDRLFNTGNVEDTTGRTQLISPPPEETLHFRRTSGAQPVRSTPSTDSSSSKRKRNMPQPAEPRQAPEATPNPKPRKQSKHRPGPAESPTRGRASTTPNHRLLSKSPHAHNPDADFIPPSASRRATARRTTPIPAYEPPSDVFTPPRVVIMTPTISKSSKRKSKRSTTAAEPVKITIKKELPQIDLSAPMPPPSPTDDPLLLSGPIEPPSSTPLPAKHPRRRIATTPSPLPPSSPPDDDDDNAAPFEWPHQEETSTDFTMDVDALPMFNFNLPGSSDVGGGGWSDTDDDDNEEEVGEGEYTGRFRTVRVRTKLDPPSSATRERMDQWGRPITPFPRKKISRLDLLKEVEEENVDVEMDQEEQQDEENEMSAHLHQDETTHSPEHDALQTSVELDQHPVHTPTPNSAFDFDASFDDPAQEEEEESLADFGIEHPMAADDTAEEDVYVATTVFSSDQEQEQHQEDPHDAEPSVDIEVDVAEEEEEEEREVREMSFVEEDDDDAFESHRDDSPSPSAVPRTTTPVPSTSTDAYIRPSTNTYTHPPAQAPMVPFPSTEIEDEVEEEHADEAVAIETVEQPRAQEEAELQPTFEHEQGHAMQHEASDSSDSDSEDIDFGVVKISSADPRAAARAAAILKQHDYDCYTKLMLKQRKRERHSLASAGIVKSTPYPHAQKDRDKAERRRTTLGAGVSIVGDRVYVPGSPVVTLPELLRVAEAEVSAHVALKTPLVRDLFKTPVKGIGGGGVRLTPVPVPGHVVLGERGWTKEEWKLLDACFTDARLELGGEIMGMASVDVVSLESVVQRFVELLGGLEVVETFGDAWTMDNLLGRVKALQNKQRAGNVAPPTTPYTPSPNVINAFAHSRRVASMEVPDFTPLGRRAPPPARAQRPVLPPPVVENAPFAHLPPANSMEKDKETERPRRKLPMSLLAPRYSHLLEEAVAVSQLSTEVADASVAHVETTDEGEEDTPTKASTTSSFPPQPRRPASASPPPPEPERERTIGTRVKGFLFSYLPTLSKTAPAGRAKAKHLLPRQPGLPLPPPALLEKARGPISTPARAPLQRAPHPKELVNLQPAPPPAQKTSLIPRARKPQRMVELHPVTPQEERRSVEVPRPRRSSGGSVKDLVKSFEELRKGGHEEAGRKELKRVRSVGEWRKTAGLAGGAAAASRKPGWKP